MGHQYGRERAAAYIRVRCLTRLREGGEKIRAPLRLVNGVLFLQPPVGVWCAMPINISKHHEQTSSLVAKNASLWALRKLSRGGWKKWGYDLYEKSLTFLWTDKKKKYYNSWCSIDLLLLSNLLKDFGISLQLSLSRLDDAYCNDFFFKCRTNNCPR